MGIFDSKSKSKSKVIPFDPGQLQGMLSTLETLGQTPIEMYPEQMYADMTPEQIEALNMRRGFASGMTGMTAPAMEAWQSTLNAADVATNPYVQNMLEQQAGLLNRNLAENLLPAIRSGAIETGNLGGTRQGVAEGIAARGTQEALARQAAQTQMGAYTAGLGQQRYGLSAAPGMAQFGMMPADILMGVGDIERAEDQMGISEAVQRFNFAQQEPWQRLQNQAALFNPLTLPYAASESRSQSTPSAFSVGTNLAALGMGAMQMPGMPLAPQSGGGFAPPTVPGGYAGTLAPYGYQMPMPNQFMPGSQMFPNQFA